MSSLTVQDLFALSWSSLPYLLLTFALMFTLNWVTQFNVRDIHVAREHRKKSTKAHIKLWRSAKMVFPLIATPAILFLPNSIGPEDAHYIYGLAILSVLAFNDSVPFYRDDLKPSHTNALWIGYYLVISAWCAGLSAGAIPLTGESKDKITYKTKEIECVSTIFTGQKVIIFVQQSKAIAITQWDSVARIDRLKGSCVVVRPNPRPSSAPR